MGFLYELKKEFEDFVSILCSLRQEKRMTVPADIDNIVVTSADVEKTLMQRNLSPRAMFPEVQRSLRYFNSLSVERKTRILDRVDQILQDKLMVFMDYNAKYTNNIGLTNNLLNNIEICAKQIAQRKIYTHKELAFILRDFQKFVAKAGLETERLTDAFIAYKSGVQDDNLKISSDNKDEYAANQADIFKQKLNNYMNQFYTLLKLLLSDSEEDRENSMYKLLNLLTDLRIDLDNFQCTATEIMNAFIPEAVNDENRFYARMRRCIEKGTELDLCFDNKFVENILIDLLLEENASVADAA